MALKRVMVAVALAAVIVWCGGAGGDVRACGPDIYQLILVNPVSPSDAAKYSHGELGVVQPTFARRYLVQAYRRFVGAARPGLDAIPLIGTSPELSVRLDAGTAPPVEDTAVTRWFKATKTVPGFTGLRDQGGFTTERGTKDMSRFKNCSDDAFATAEETLRVRIRQFGATTPAVKSWLTAQTAVFDNCGGSADTPAVLPAPAESSLDPIFKADRAYQVAAAHFYATHYEQAETLFRAIGDDRSSPWQPFGRFLAARAMIRRATVNTSDKTAANALLARADDELAAILADASLAPVHVSARGLRNFVAVNVHPIDRLHAAAHELSSAATPSPQDYIDYSVLMDRLVNEDTRYAYDAVKNRDALMHDDDLTDWILAMQGAGDAGEARAIARWKTTGAIPWLVAAMWRIGTNDPATSEVLSAAAALSPDSPAFPTVAFLRVRLLMARNDRADARAVLNTLPDTPGAGFPAEAVNLLRAQRVSLATTLDEWLRAAPRLPVASGWMWSAASGDPVGGAYSQPTFDVDAAMALTEQFSLARLADIAHSALLPARLRLKVANEAWTRAVELRDDQTGLAAAAMLKTLAPQVSPDLDRYITATSADTRHAAGILMLLRWSGLRNYVPVTEEVTAYRASEPRGPMALDAVGANWWCGADPPYREAGPYDWSKEHPLGLPWGALPMRPSTPATPDFVSADERVRAAQEFQRLTSLGSAPTYLATEAANWADTRPKDPDVAEALARAVKATHFGCGDPQTGKASERAFALLHKLYPNTSWAKATPYWYEGR